MEGNCLNSWPEGRGLGWYQDSKVWGPATDPGGPASCAQGLNGYEKKHPLGDREQHNSTRPRGAASLSEGTESPSPICGLDVLLLNITSLRSRKRCYVPILSSQRPPPEPFRWPQETSGAGLERLWLEGDSGMSPARAISILQSRLSHLLRNGKARISREGMTAVCAHFPPAGGSAWYLSHSPGVR